MSSIEIQTAGGDYGNRGVEFARSAQDGLDWKYLRTTEVGLELSKRFRLAVGDPSKFPEFIDWSSRQASEHVYFWPKAVLWACASGRTKFIQALIEKNGLKKHLLSAKDPDGFNCLHRAVMSGKSEMLKLISSVAQENFQMLHARTKEGWTALHLAVVCAKDDNDLHLFEELKLCYSRCNKPDSRSWDFRDNFWLTPMHYAVLEDTKKAFHLLFDTWFDKSAVNQECTYHLNAIDYFRRTALHMACGHSAPAAVVEKLIDWTDYNAVDCCSFTPLHWAVYSGATDVVRFLTSQVSERSVRATEQDAEGRPVLQLAIEYDLRKGIQQKQVVGKDMQKLLLLVPEVKDEVERLYRDRQVFVDAANAILVGAALIASVTFGGWLQPPSGSDAENQLFWTFNSLSFFFSIATVTAGAATVLPMSEVYIGSTVLSIKRWLAFTSALLLISVMFVLGAFGTAGFASLPHSPRIQPNMIVTTSIGTLLCTGIGVLFVIRLIGIHAGWVPFLAQFFHTFRESQQTDMLDIELEIGNALGDSPSDENARIEIAPTFGRAFDREASIKTQINKQGYPGFRKHQTASDKADLVKQRIKAYEEAYEEVRRTPRLPPESIASNTRIVAKLGQKSPGLHRWTKFSLTDCRERALDKDDEDLKRIKDRIKSNKERLAEEHTKFMYEGFSFD